MKPTSPDNLERDRSSDAESVDDSPKIRAADASAAGPWGRLARKVVKQVYGARVALLALVHIGIFSVVYWLSFALRFDFAVPQEIVTIFWISLPVLLYVKLPVYYFCGHYHGWWSFVTFSDLTELIRAASMSLLLFVLVDYYVLEQHQVPRVVIALDYILSIVALGAIRLSWRQFREQFSSGVGAADATWALLIGADHASAILAYQIQSHLQLPYRIRGFVAVEGEKKGTRLGQIPVLGSLEDIREIAKAAEATDILMTAGKLPGAQLRILLEACDDLGLNLKIIRPAEDRFEGDRRIPIRDIEINDLLQRDPVVLDQENIGKLLEGRVVMVTGAGGSIGSEICRQVQRFNPTELVLVGNGENPIFKIEKELAVLNPSILLTARIGSITDDSRMRQVFDAHRPEVVFHAAAHKHVPLMENNVGQSVQNNVCGTQTLADLADEFGVRNFVSISTDKAVHPTSVMGTTKHLAERYVHAMSQVSSTKFTVVRFGNVLGSDGSVVPIFQEQIRNGGPITVTDPEMTRFFMTIPEASQLVLQAASMGSGGEIFVLEMGKPVKIVDLARDLIRLSGLPENTIEIMFTGIRPGEKLYEELYFEDEETIATSHSKVRAANHRPRDLAEVRKSIEQLRRLVHEPEEILRAKLRELVPEFVPPSERNDSQAGEDSPSNDSGNAPLQESPA